VQGLGHMDEQTVRDLAQAQCDALLAGDINRASQDMSPELRAHLGQVVALLPMPLTEATIESIERTGSGFRAVLHLVGDNEARLETRWKDRDGKPTMVEASHLSDADAGATGPPSTAPEAGA
jgi:hypothetical protein